MCDYSLFAIPNRLAQEQEELVAHRFPTGSMGLASPADLRKTLEPKREGPNSFWSTIRNFFSFPKSEPVPAVCIPPGARLRMEDIPARLQQELGVQSSEEVVFIQTGVGVNTYRDAVRFENGRELSLQELREGQRMLVLSIALSEVPDDFLTQSEELELHRVW